MKHQFLSYEYIIILIHIIIITKIIMNGFEIISKLGDGAYSVVYKVKRIADGKITH